MSTLLSSFLSLTVIALLVGCGGTTPAGPGGVVLLRYAPGSESTTQREEGFLDTLKEEYPEIHILSSDQYSGTTAEESLSKAQQMLIKYGDRIEGVFAVCEPNANGVLEALDEQGLAGKVPFVGFDPNERMVQALAQEKMHGIVLQDPVTMGYLAVQTMVKHLDGKADEIERRVSTGEYMATPQNMEEKRMAELLSPAQFDSAPPVNQPKYRIAVIPKGTTHEFWKSVHYGAQKAADEIGGVEILWKGPQLENDRDGQISLVQDFITKKVDGICLAPLDSQSLVPAVLEAKDAGIPTVIFDSGLDNEAAYVSYVATDNYLGGALAAHRLAEVLGHKPKSDMAPKQASDKPTDDAASEDSGSADADAGKSDG
ncbi:MAG: substrate-binding domain-containing protein [Pirellulaceae bacterium]